MPALPDFLLSAYHDGFITRTDGSQYPCHSNISQEEAETIHRLVLATRPRRTLEIGFCLGFSGIAILNALDECAGEQHFAIDPMQSTLAHNLGRENVTRLGLDRLATIIEDFPENVVARIPSVQFDFIIADKKLDAGGIIGFHDLWMPSLQKVIRYILTNRDYTLVASDSPPPAPPRLKQRARSLAARLARSLPRSTSIFSSSILHPFHEICSGNMVFLRKNGPDTRDWRHFQNF